MTSANLRFCRERDYATIAILVYSVCASLIQRTAGILHAKRVTIIRKS